MNVKILFAERNDEEELREILWEYGMDISGEIEDHLVIKKDHKVLAGGKVIEFEEKHFFLEVIGVKQDNRAEGFGGILLGEISKNPWLCAKSMETKPDDKNAFFITTVARGEAEGFYKKYGYVPCDFNEIPLPYREQCADCPEREDCNPVPMILRGGK